MSATEENPAPLPADTTLQPPVRLSDSNLWQLQRNYYDQAGADAWETGIVPSFITTNAFLARQYAHLCLQFIRDFAAAPGSALDADEPIYIVELGSGHGKLGFLFLRQLELLRSEYPTVRLEQLKYVMTDFTAVNVRYWETHTSLREYVASGQLDFATFDAENDERLRLCHSGVEISAQTVRCASLCLPIMIFDLPDFAHASLNLKVSTSSLSITFFPFSQQSHDLHCQLLV